MNQVLSIQGLHCSFDIPDICPLCNIGIIPVLIAYNASVEASLFGITIKCPSCKNIFFALYEILPDKHRNISSLLIAVYPEQDICDDLPPKIKDYFPEFHKIYCQARIAENKNLDEIMGMAYRKSLEFLIKKYLIQKLPNETIAIESETLGASIRRIEFPSIKALATAATWLGNDQTHIVQKHKNYDVKDMKSFIMALCHLIISERVADEALKLIKK